MAAAAYVLSGRRRPRGRRRARRRRGRRRASRLLRRLRRPRARGRLLGRGRRLAHGGRLHIGRRCGERRACGRCVRARERRRLRLGHAAALRLDEQDGVVGLERRREWAGRRRHSLCGLCPLQLRLIVADDAAQLRLGAGLAPLATLGRVLRARLLRGGSWAGAGGAGLQLVEGDLAGPRLVAEVVAHSYDASEAGARLLVVREHPQRRAEARREGLGRASRTIHRKIQRAISRGKLNPQTTSGYTVRQCGDIVPTYP